ncbi:MAG: hypothetical protein K9L57_10580 [Spirochaetaceae bacterium]|nr:hypothetical protein [Spirochaetaceae bacterium]
MRIISGTIKNYFFVYHIAANIVLSIIHFLWFEPSLNENTRIMSPVESAGIMYGVINIFLCIIIYTPFYMNKISILYYENKRLIIDNNTYKINEIQAITRFEIYYARNSQVYYLLKMGEANSYRIYKVAERACWKDLNPLYLFGLKSHEPLAHNLRILGVTANVQKKSK